ncbi:uncharacterized protein [Eurosta solidaginis]|uniref:uncharacterized protein n=1 Tax=Eurosta solidaginis TaxID=178769 RepID=UPI00353062AC
MKENIVQVNRQEEHHLEENARDVNCVEDSLSQQGETNCTCCKEIEKSLRKEIQELKDSVSNLTAYIKGELKNSIDHQSSVVMGTLAEHTVLMEKLLFQEREVSALGEVFPIKDDCQLNELNENINGENKHIYVNIVNKILRNKIDKNIDLSFDPELVYEYNLDGSHGKKNF